MNVFKVPNHTFTDYYDIARFRLAWKINLLLTISLLGISLFFLFNNIVTFYQYFIGFLICLAGVIYILFKRTYKEVSYFLAGSGLILVIYSIVSVKNIPHLIEPLWLVIITIFSYFNLGKIVGHIVLLLVAIFQSYYFYFLLNTNEPVRYIFSNSELIGLILEVCICFFILGYFIYNFIQTTSFAEGKLKESNQFLNAILDNIPNMIFVKRANDLRFLKINKSGEDFLGFNLTNLIGKNEFDLLPAKKAEMKLEEDRVVLEEKKTLDIPVEPVDYKSEIKWIHTQKVPILNEAREPQYLLIISEDITDRKNQEDKIKQLNVELKGNLTSLEEVNKELEAFTYTVSHDLRSPLRSIDGYSQILIEDFSGKLNNEGKRVLLNIRSNAERMGKLIDDLLAFSRLGRKELKKTMINMNELINSVVGEVNNSISNRTEIKVHKLKNIKGDYTLLHQVWFNLLANAIKFSSKKNSPTVEISSEDSKNEVIYSIKDNGAGFDMNYINKLFQVFQRLHSQEEFSGTGVGLAIVARIINKHGGKIWAEGIPGEGAIFKFSIPKTVKR